MTIAVVLPLEAIAVGTGLGEGHLSRQHCEGSRQQADKLLIKPRRVGQVGAGSTRDRSNERHAQSGQYSRESPRTAGTHPAGPALPGRPQTHSVLVAGSLPRTGLLAE